MSRSLFAEKTREWEKFRSSLVNNSRIYKIFQVLLCSFLSTLHKHTNRHPQVPSTHTHDLLCVSNNSKLLWIVWRVHHSSRKQVLEMLPCWEEMTRLGHLLFGWSIKKNDQNVAATEWKCSGMSKSEQFPCLMIDLPKCSRLIYATRPAGIKFIQITGAWTAPPSPSPLGPPNLIRIKAKKQKLKNYYVQELKREKILMPKSSTT